MMQIEMGKINQIPILFFFLSMYSVGTLSSYTMSWTYTILILGISGLLMLLIGKMKFVINSVSKAWIIVILICFIASIRTMDFRDFTFYLLTGIVIVASYSLSDRCLNNCFFILVVGAMLFLVGILIQFFMPSFYDSMIFPLFPSYYRKDIIRQYYAHKMYTGINSEASISAQFMMMGIAALYCIFPNLKNKSKKYAVGLGIILFIGVIKKEKRSSFLFLITALIYTSLKSAIGKQKNERILKLLLMTVLVITIAYFILPSIIENSSSRNALVRLLEYSNDDDITNGRLAIWTDTIVAFNESPLLGKGWSWYRSVHGMGAHNIYLQLLCECGLLGAVPVYAVLGYLFWMCQKKLVDALIRKNNIHISVMKFCLFTQTYILLYGFTGNPLYNYSFFIWYAFSICLLTNICIKTKTMAVREG